MKNLSEKSPFQFIETVRIENGVLWNCEYHDARVSETFAKYFPNNIPFLLNDIKLNSIPEAGKYKLRIVYSGNEKDCSITKYFPKEISSVKVVECSAIDYSFKFEDRSIFSSFNQNCDEVIITKNGLVTDSSFSNLAFCDSGKWFTPDTFLLNGTMRRKLLTENNIKEKKIGVGDIKSFEKISFINSMLDLGECCISTDKIVLSY